MPLLDTVKKLINIFDYLVSVRDKVKGYFRKLKRAYDEKKADNAVNSLDAGSVRGILSDIKEKRDKRRNSS